MYRKRVYVFDGDRPVQAIVRNYTADDFDDLIRIQQMSFPPPFPSELWWNKEQLASHVEHCPQGALCVELDGVVAGSITGLIIQFDEDQPEHTWEEVTDSGYIRNHNPHGDTLYIVDICVQPAYRKFGLAKLMMQSTCETVVQLGLARLLGGGRMPGYGKYALEMSAEQYLEQVLTGRIKDPVITFLLRCGRTPVRILKEYVEDDESRNYAVLMEWSNPFIQN